MGVKRRGVNTYLVNAWQRFSLPLIPAPIDTLRVLQKRPAGLVQGVDKVIPLLAGRSSADGNGGQLCGSLYPIKDAHVRSILFIQGNLQPWMCLPLQIMGFLYSCALGDEKRSADPFLASRAAVRDESGRSARGLAYELQILQKDYKEPVLGTLAALAKSILRTWAQPIAGNQFASDVSEYLKLHML